MLPKLQGGSASALRGKAFGAQGATTQRLLWRHQNPSPACETKHRLWSDWLVTWSQTRYIGFAALTPTPTLQSVFQDAISGEEEIPFHTVTAWGLHFGRVTQTSKSEHPLVRHTFRLLDEGVPRDDPSWALQAPLKSLCSPSPAVGGNLQKPIGESLQTSSSQGSQDSSSSCPLDITPTSALT